MYSEGGRGPRPIGEKLLILEILNQLFHFELCALRWSIDRIRVLLNGEKRKNM